MANQKTTKSAAKQTPPGDDGYEDRIPETYNRIFQTWSSFRQDLEGQIDENLKKQQKMYDDFFGRWNRLSGEVGNRLSREGANEAQRELYNVWRNYSNKIGPRMTKAMTEGLQGYGSISASLQKYSSKVSSEAQNLAQGKSDPRKVEELYESWLDFGRTIKRQMDSAMNQEWMEMEQLSRTWLEFNNRVGQLMSNVSEKTGDYTDFARNWQKLSQDMSNSLNGVMSGTTQDMDKLQKTWATYYARVEKEMMHLADDIGMGYEDLYTRLLDQQSKSLEQMSQWWQTASEAARKEMSALQSRMVELEKRIRETTH